MEDQKKLEGIKKIFDDIIGAHNKAQETYEASKEARRGEVENQAKHNNLAKDNWLVVLKERTGDCSESEVAKRVGYVTNKGFSPGSHHFAEHESIRHRARMGPGSLSPLGLCLGRI